jgi:glucose-1-phosphate thymidylyltransferase
VKGLILSGGRGTRLRPITYTSAKQLVPVANKPVLFFGIEAMAAAGIREIGIIIAPETGEEIKTVTGDGSAFGVEITYILQDEPNGLAHAVLTAEPFLGDSPFVMYLGDNLLQGGITELVDAFRTNAPDALILLTPVPDPENFGVAELTEGRVTRLVEKPPEPQTDLALCGVYMFTAGIHDAARAIEPSGRGELEITDAIQHLVDTGQRVEPHVVQGWWKDTGRLDDMLEANRLVLDTIDSRTEGTVDDASTTHGRVIIEPGASLTRSTVRGPAIIGAGAQLTDAYIGPYTAVGPDCVVERAEVEHSILLEGSSVRNLDTGSKGMLGGRVLAVAAERGHEAIGTDLPELDLTDATAVRDVIAGAKPDVVIHCAAFTDVDGAEADEERATLVNATGSANVANVAPYVIAMSTDYVFPGDAGRGKPYLESDETGPATAYGRSKVLAERAVLGAGDHAIVRTQWLYGAGGKNFVDTILRLAGERDELSVVYDQVGTPTWTGHLAPALIDVGERRGTGIFHATGGGEATWHGLAIEACARAEVSTRVVAVTSEEFARPAPRPAYSVLGSERSDALELPDWRQGVLEHLREGGRVS